jgi:hypothetical protein
MTMPTHTQNRKLLCVATGVRRSTARASSGSLCAAGEQNSSEPDDDAHAHPE